MRHGLGCGAAGQHHPCPACDRLSLACSSGRPCKTVSVWLCQMCQTGKPARLVAFYAADAAQRTRHTTVSSAKWRQQPQHVMPLGFCSLMHAGRPSAIVGDDSYLPLHVRYAAQIAHGILMVAAFCVFMPAGIVVARHKWMFANKEVGHLRTQQRLPVHTCWVYIFWSSG